MKQDWSLENISNVSTLVNGGTPKTNIKEYWNGDIAWITPADLGKLKTTIVTKTIRTISEEGLNKSSAKLFPKNSVILSTRAPIGYLAINGVLMATNQGCRGIIPSENLDTFYLYYFLKSNVTLLNSLGTGTTFKELSTKALGSVKIPIPHIEQQKQIVKILDKSFEAIEKAKTNIEKNLQNTKELFASKLNEIFSQKGEGWEEKTLGEITSKIGSGATPRGGQSSYKESGISLIRSMNVHDNGFKKDKLAFIDDEQAKKLNNVTIEENDVLLNITGASVARCCIVDKSFLPARVNQHVSIIRIKDDILLSEYLHYSLISDNNKKALLGIGEQGATRQAITKVQIENFVVRYPKYRKVQLEKLNELNNLKQQTKQLEQKYQEKLNNLEELKKSILQKAFSGELLK